MLVDERYKLTFLCPHCNGPFTIPLGVEKKGLSAQLLKYIEKFQPVRRLNIISAFENYSFKTVENALMKLKREEAIIAKPRGNYRINHRRGENVTQEG